MPTYNPIVTSLLDYVKQNNDILIATSVLGAESAKLFTLQTDVKGKSAINILSTDIAFGASCCGWNPAGSQTLTQRIIDTGIVSVQMVYCWEQLIGKFAETGVRIAAGEERLPFEEDFLKGVAQAIAEANEKLIWQGDTTSADDNLNKYDGLLKILANEATVIAVSIASTSGAFDAIVQMITAIPPKDLKSDLRIFCSPEFFRNYCQELVAKNLFHYAPYIPEYERGKEKEIIYSSYELYIPGTTIILTAVPGLSGVSPQKLVAARTSNIYYGCDMMNDKETFDFWYSQDNSEFRLKCCFNAGVQVAFPDEVVVGTIANP